MPYKLHYQNRIDSFATFAECYQALQEYGEKMFYYEKLLFFKHKKKIIKIIF